MTSPDGITWTSRNSAADEFWAAIEWADEADVLVAVNGVGTVMTSVDGINWTLRATGSTNSLRALVWSGTLSRLVVVANSGTGNRVLTSP